MMKYPVENQYCDFCSDLWDPFYGIIPCVGATREYKECKDMDYSLADTLIAEWDVSAPIPIGGGHGVRLGNDLLVDRPEWGAGQQRCKECPAGKYIHKESLWTKPKFQQITCKQCPKGMPSARITDDITLFIPQDVREMTTEHLPDVVFPEADYGSFGCRACSKSAGVPINNVCTQCKRTDTQVFEQYEHAEKVDVGVKGITSLIVATECKFCPAGYEYYNKDKSSDKVACRSMTGVLDCCRICLFNSYSAGKGARCTKVPNDKGTVTSFGASEPISCAVGEELVYCTTAGFCLNSVESRRIGWRTCRPCALSDTKRADIAGVCKECKDEKMDLADKTIQTRSVCKLCSSCQQLITTPGEEVLHVIPTDAERRASILLWEVGQEIKNADWTYMTAKASATCSPLPRRTIKNNELASLDEYRPNLHAQEIKRVPDFHTLHRVSGNCTITRCADVCLSYFHYSPGCGQQEVNLDNIWVLKDNDPRSYISLSAEDKKISLNVTHGTCQLCKTCTKGQYNGMCNVHMVGNNPVGSCQSCLTECAENFFMHHSEKEGGCHSPPETQRSANNMWKINENYVCQRCPTWVRQQDNISIVTACGFRQKYMGWAWDENSRISAQQQDVSFKNWESEIAELGPNYRNFRSFMRDLVMYCPAGYFYDESIPNCNLVEQSQTYKVPGTGGNIVSIGYGTYNPNCCQPCTKCPHFTKKDTSNWKACLGDSLSDTQDACVDRCGAMYWENKTASECRRCNTCHEGFLALG
jgi:hypothetical protein